MAGKPRGLRLPEDLEREIEREKERRGTSFSAAVVDLLRESVRMRRVPGIVFADGPSGRRDIAAMAVRIESADSAEVQRAGFGSFPQPAILVTGVHAPDLADPAATPPAPLTGRAVAVLDSQPVITVVLDGFHGVPEGGDG